MSKKNKTEASLNWEALAIEQINSGKVLEIMADSQFPIIFPLYNGRCLPVKVKHLSNLELQSCGSFSLLDLDPEAKGKDLDFVKDRDKIIKIKNFHEALVKASLVSPTFNQIIEMVDSQDNTRKLMIKEIENLKLKRDQYKKCKDADAVMLEQLNIEIENIEIGMAFPLPDDFTGCVVQWALSIDKDKVSQISEQILFRAAMNSHHSKGALTPADYFNGSDLTDFNIKDINERGYALVNEYLAHKRIEAEALKSGRRHSSKLLARLEG